MTTKSDLEVALRTALPVQWHSHVPDLARVLEDALTGHAPTLTDPSLLPLVESLYGISLRTTSGTLTVSQVDRQSMTVEHGSTRLIIPLPGDHLNASQSQGFINHPSGPVYQHFGDINLGPIVGAGDGHQAVAQPVQTTDPLSPYEMGLRVLLARLGSDHPCSSEVLVYEQRLCENLRAARRYGDTRERAVARAEVIDRLNDLARAAVGVSFNELCGSGA
ncbi:MAG: hypothetical protein HC884_17230 [Chloroflexaceae bacterium]|nr:hypothetical protein [Chloroflexaceae bacterium]